MAITRTAKGTAATNAAGTTLTVNNVSLTAGDLLIVGVGYETDADIVSVTWGGRELTRVRGTQAGQGDTRVRLYRAKVKNTATRNVVITWAASMSARAMFVSAFTEVGKKEAKNNASFAAGTTNPNTGAAVQTLSNDTVQVAAFVSGGPSGDNAGTVGDGHTAGQRVGTTGAGAASNVTIQETYEILSAPGDVRSSITGATGRIWACTIAAFGPDKGRLVVEAATRITLDDSELQEMHEALAGIIEANLTALSNAMPEAAQTDFTDQQKVDAYIYSVLRFPSPAVNE